MYGVVDVGTSSLKFFVYDSDLRLRYKEVVPNYTYHDGTQDPNFIADVVRHFTRKARELGVKTYGIATYRASVVAWRRDGRPATPIYTWLAKCSSRRALQYLRWLPRVGVVFSEISPLYRFLKAYFDCRDCYIWTIDSYIAYILTGHYVSDATNAAMSGLIHPKTLKPIPLLTELTRLDIEFPEIVDNYADLGETNGMELRVLIADQQSASIAEGATATGRIKVTLSTGLFVDIPTENYQSGRGVPLLLYKIGGEKKYGTEFHLPSVGIFIDKLVQLGVLKYEDFSSSELTDEYIYILPTVAGLTEPRYLWTRGAVVGISTTTSRSTLASSITATLGFFTKFYIDKSGQRPSVVVVNGGGARFANYLRCLASLLDAEVLTPLDYEGTARGVLTLLHTGGSIKQDRRPWSYKSLEGGNLKCREKYQSWKRRIKYLKNLKPFFRVE